MNKETRARSITTDGKPPAPGFGDASAPQPIGPTGQHGAYWILSEEERAKGFVRPYRRGYRHVGPLGPTFPLRDLTEEERERYRDQDYSKWEEYPESESPVVGRFWSSVQLAAVGSGCGAETTMGSPLCETYARDPDYYGETFCVGCRKHLPVGEFRWLEDGQVVGS